MPIFTRKTGMSSQDTIVRTIRSSGCNLDSRLHLIPCGDEMTHKADFQNFCHKKEHIVDFESSYDSISYTFRMIGMEMEGDDEESHDISMDFDENLFRADQSNKHESTIEDNMPFWMSDDNEDSEISLKEKTKPRVSFSTLEIRTYESIIGDHPCCTSGPPISLGWHYDPSATIELNIEDFEKRQSIRRHRSELRLSCMERREFLSRCCTDNNDNDDFDEPESSSNIISPRALIDIKKQKEELIDRDVIE
eukprot:CAMPEP_0184856108 /NCGR_PEP_ID=MMETSP0580-20130426/1284_1 /TAXON_ID=1118495 /ORGANISM="Dactyliosolen fragilissimus" /LENGTH=249 /DNA_ID=CAMNT_0027350927 /DNA_START=289 /DNA_END=1039 /DNA_ORIENTATION=-